MEVPARQAYSHWASVGRAYSQPAGRRPAVCSMALSRARKTWAQVLKQEVVQHQVVEELEVIELLVMAQVHYKDQHKN